GVSYSFLQDQISNDEVCLQIKLIFISNLIILEIENILKKYQIQVDNFLDKRYVKDFSSDKQLDISQMAYNLKNGVNKNEIQITSKSSKKLGFFEKFFQLFS
ncbi:hypothetical protein, partial [Candidatus Pelagibacter sp. HIMB1521]|uniref:hypothetical protein n=1 Tax=Candidatus Pelagibacter sp. HIMB1521 TaxID=3413344 RepID=UPI003F874223